MLQTVDFFRASVSDPYLFGCIAAQHALGDCHAMGATPTSALAIAVVPYAAEAQACFSALLFFLSLTPARVKTMHSQEVVYMSGIKHSRNQFSSPVARTTLSLVQYVQMEEELFQMMAGAAAVLSAAGCALVGGHSSEGPEAALGFAITGATTPALQLAVSPAAVLQKSICCSTALPAACVVCGRVQRVLEECS